MHIHEQPARGGRGRVQGLKLKAMSSVKSSQDAGTEQKRLRWRPLESNPETLNSYIRSLGVTNNWQFCDVYGLDPELLCMIPQPCCAFILLFPITENYVNHFLSEKESIEKSGQKVCENLFYMKQTIGNACGTIGVIHAIGNATDKIELKEGSTLKIFLDRVKGMKPAEVGASLESDESFAESHTEAAVAGQTAPMAAEAPLDLHFVALVNKEGSLYELDGRKSFPINHGPTSTESFVSDAAEVCKKFMSRDQAEMRFTILALSQV